MLVLGIETSCDETSVSVVGEKNGKPEILSNIISSQVPLHAKWGGVVPNLAAREHLKNLPLIIRKALEESGKKLEEIGLIAVTKGPGLIPALLVGTGAAKTLSYISKKPLIGIHHIEGHIYSSLIGKDPKSVRFPILCLVISGGHTQLVLMEKHFEYEIIGETQDDAVGEAFDKVARILGLGYPGGPAISKEAEEAASQKISGEPPSLPRPMINSGDLNFSFSGLKTAVLYLTKDRPALLDEGQRKIVAHEFQEAVSEVLEKKTLEAVRRFSPKTVLLSGGVSANRRIRERLASSLKESFPDVDYLIPDIRLTGDNAAMIATAGLLRLKLSDRIGNLDDNWKNLETKADLGLNR